MSDNIVIFDGQTFRKVSHGAAGDCLFNCLNAQLRTHGSQALREQIVHYICLNWEEFRVFISDVLHVEDQQSYAAKMSRPGEYGSLNELKAACTIFDIGVVVIRQRRDGTYFKLDINIPNALTHFYLLFTGNENDDHYLDGHFQVLEPVDPRKF